MLSAHPHLKSSPSELPGRGPSDDEVELGRVSGVFGVHGEVRLYLHNPESDLFLEERRVVLIAPDGRRFNAHLSSRPGAGKRILGRIRGLVDRESAAALKDFGIYIPAADLPPAEPGSTYVHEIVGFPVFVGDRQVGTLTMAHSTDAADILEIETKEGPQFVPCVDTFVLAIDRKARRIVLSENALG